jgi:hypothetical protein
MTVQEYTEAEQEEISASLFRRLHSDVIEMVVHATAAGWRAVVTSPDSITLRAPGDPCPRQIHFSAKSRHRINGKKVADDIVRYGDPYLVKGIKTLAKDRKITMEMFEAAIEATSQVRGEFEMALPPKPEPRKEKTVAARRIIKQGPMLAKASEGKGYHSEVSIERHWSDGSTDYACSYPKCDYTTENRLSVRGHWQVHIKAGEVEKFERGETREVDVPLAVTYAPRQSRVDALAAHLATLGEMDVDALAKAALMWVHEQSRSRSEHAAEYDVPEDGDILNRIRALLGKDEAQRATYEAERAEEAEREVARLTEALAEQVAHTAKVAGDLRTLKELVAGMGDE